MKVKLTSGTRRNSILDIPEADAKKLIKKNFAESTEKKKATKKAK